MITILQTTSSDKKELEKMLDHLVETNKAACGHVEEAISSVYVWKGEVNHSDEYTVKIKTTTKRRDEIIKYIQTNHSYELPEITWWEVNAIPEYEEWVENQTS